jgi:DNA-binding NtrC family response regulator
LRFLQEKEFRPVGGVKNITVDVRLIAATNKDLEKMIKEQQFREDLYYRLNIVPVRLPSLSERKEDIPLLVQHFLAKYNKKQKKNVEYVSPDAMQCLIDYEWSGNVRELENIVERMVIMCESDTIDIHCLPTYVQGKQVCFHIATPRTNEELKQHRKQIRSQAVEKIERAFLLDALKRNEWNVTRAAQDVGMKRQNFQALMRKYSIKQG